MFPPSRNGTGTGKPITGQQRIAGLRHCSGDELDRTAVQGIVLSQLLQHAVAVDRQAGSRVGYSREIECGVDAVHSSGKRLAIYETGRRTAARPGGAIHADAVGRIAGSAFERSGGVYHRHTAGSITGSLEWPRSQIRDQAGHVGFLRRGRDAIRTDRTRLGLRDAHVADSERCRARWHRPGLSELDVPVAVVYHCVVGRGNRGRCGDQLHPQVSASNSDGGDLGRDCRFVDGFETGPTDG